MIPFQTLSWVLRHTCFLWQVQGKTPRPSLPCSCEAKRVRSVACSHQTVHLSLCVFSMIYIPIVRQLYMLGGLLHRPCHFFLLRLRVVSRLTPKNNRGSGGCLLHALLPLTSGTRCISSIEWIGASHSHCIFSHIG